MLVMMLLPQPMRKCDDIWILFGAQAVEPARALPRNVPQRLT